MLDHTATLQHFCAPKSGKCECSKKLKGADETNWRGITDILAPIHRNAPVDTGEKEGRMIERCVNQNIFRAQAVPYLSVVFICITQDIFHIFIPLTGFWLRIAFPVTFTDQASMFTYHRVQCDQVRYEGRAPSIWESRAGQDYYDRKLRSIVSTGKYL